MSINRQNELLQDYRNSNYKNISNDNTTNEFNYRVKGIRNVGSLISLFLCCPFFNFCVLNANV